MEIKGMEKAFEFKSKAILNTAIKIFCLFAFVPISACSFIRTKRHLPFFVEPTNVLFKDNDGGCYFSPSVYSLLKYNYDCENHYERVNFYRDEDNFSFVDAVANDDYVFMEFETFSTKSLHKISVYDKKLELKETFKTGDQNTVFRGMACTNKCLYWAEEKHEQNNYTRMLFKYDVTNNSTELLSNSFEQEGLYQDEEISFFFNRYGFSKYSKKTKLLYLNIDRNPVLRTDKIELSLYKGALTLTNGDKSHKLKPDQEFNCLYENAYLIDNQLIFATYRGQNDADCGYPSGNYCVCGWKESYLYTIDLETNQLNLVEKYDSGTILLDYDSSGSQYYFKGGLYNHGEFCRKCEEIKPKESKEMDMVGLHQYYNSNEIKNRYYPSFFEGQFYGI